ncbi:MAG TPA: carboxypeptidase-like regulatory domain-containing protein [Gemmataceae bacterium]|nr:carboxypeptidase-like regulatory domain-containing protein [Gemmataceae bacterium]
MKARCWIAAIILGLAPMAICAQEEIKVTGRVVDATGKPAAGVEVSRMWLAENGAMKPHKSAITDARGQFTLPVTFYGLDQGLMALDKERKTGGLIIVEEKSAGKPVEIKLTSLVHVH